MESVTLDCNGRQVRVCRAIGLRQDDSLHAWAPLPRGGGLDLTLLRHALAANGQAREALHRMLQEDDDGLGGAFCGQSRPALIQRIVSRVMAGHWVVLWQVTAAQHSGAHVLARPKDSAADEALPGISPSSLFGRSAGAPESSGPASSAAPKAEVLLFARANQDKQAATLKEAAAQGVPFCEVCERARALREAA